MATEPMENESMLGVLIVLFLVVVSTIYVFSQQQQQRIQTPGAGARQGGLPGFPGGAAAAAHHLANAVSTASLSEKQLRLHRSLPSRNGARAITICADSLVKNKTDATAIAWANGETPRVLTDLLLVADVYILCKLDSDDQHVRARIQQFLTESEAVVTLASKRVLKPHKILFCKSTIGKIAFVRQIEPQVHVEVDPSVVQELEKHVPRIVNVVPTLGTTPNTGVHHVTDSFATYFDLLGAM